MKVKLTAIKAIMTKTNEMIQKRYFEGSFFQSSFVLGTLGPCVRIMISPFSSYFNYYYKAINVK
jgi:hypothetical protein